MSGVKGSSGRHKTPTAILVKRGSWRGKERKNTEPEVMPDRFVIPKGLSLKVQDYYNANLSEFKARGIIDDNNNEIFEMRAKAYVRWREVDNMLRDNDNEIARMFDKDPESGKIILSVIAKEEKERFSILQSVLIQFGATPVTRANVNKTDVRNAKTTLKVT